MNKKRFPWLGILLVIGMLVSLFLTYEHFSETASKYCTFGESLDCGVVNKSPYANLDGISYLLTIDFGWPLPLINISNMNFFFDLITAVSFLGFLTLLFIFLARIAKNKNKDFLFIKKENNIKWIRGVLIFGIAFGFYLFLIQHFILQTYCLFCLILDLVMILALITAFIYKE